MRGIGEVIVEKKEKDSVGICVSRGPKTTNYEWENVGARESAAVAVAAANIHIDANYDHFTFFFVFCICHRIPGHLSNENSNSFFSFSHCRHCSRVLRPVLCHSSSLYTNAIDKKLEIRSVNR